MKVIHAAKELQSAGRKACAAIGFFDGVHLGHQQIIRQTVADARQHEGVSLVVTFDQHPNAVVAPGRVPQLIDSLPKKLRVIESLGVDALLLIRFDRAFSEKTAEQFIRELVDGFSPVQSICVGSNFKFGHKREGSVAMLKTFGDKLNFTVHGMAAVALDGQPVSSTRIRDAIHAGDLDAASQMLGRAYSLGGKVIEGDKLGYKLGFPTANLDAVGLVLPPSGVYAIHANVDGKAFRGVLNIGFRPTLRELNPKLHVEAHLLDFSCDLYGKEMEITFVEKLRDEKKFPSVEELKKQIASDVAEAKIRF